MRYTKEFKLECVKKRMNGEALPFHGGCKYKTFLCKVDTWRRIYNQLGEVGLERKKPLLSIEDKLNLINRIQDGESYTVVAASIGRQADFISRIYKIYLQEGVEGLQSHSKKGRPPTMKKKIDTNVDLNTLSKDEQIKVLKQQLEDAQIENEYLKKLSALVQERKARQQKKK